MIIYPLIIRPLFRTPPVHVITFAPTKLAYSIVAAATYRMSRPENPQIGPPLSSLLTHLVFAWMLCCVKRVHDLIKLHPTPKFKAHFGPIVVVLVVV